MSPHEVCPWAHVHLPAAQAPPGGHSAPHFPQFAGSFDSFTHAEPHMLSPTAQADPHAPFEHTSPVAQVCPHDPQLPGSLVVSVQEPEHEVSVPAQAVDGASPQFPLMHW